MFQESLDCEFPDITSIRTHGNTVKFASLLSDHPELMIKIICDRLAEHEQLGFENNLSHEVGFLGRSYSCNTLLKEILDELDFPSSCASRLIDTNPGVFPKSENTPERSSRSVISYIMVSENKSSTRNYVLASQSHSRNKDTGSDKFCAPLMWKLRRKIDSVQVKDDVLKWMQSATNYYSISLVVMDGLSIRLRRHPLACSEECFGTSLVCDITLWRTKQCMNTLDIFQELKKHFNIVLNMVFWCGIRIDSGAFEEQLGLDLLQLMKSGNSINVNRCTFPKSVWQQLATRNLDPENLKQLTLCRLYNFHAIYGKENEGHDLPTEVVNMLMSRIFRCKHLSSLEINRTRLTMSLQKCSFGIIFSDLETLWIERAELEKCDVMRLFNAITKNTFPKLKTLRLGSNMLTDCISILQECDELPPLEILDLSETWLSKKDIISLSELGKQGRLPKLKTLSLSYNNMTNMLADFFGSPDHPGFTVLEVLDMILVNLTQNDIVTLANAVQDSKLAALKVLSLSLYVNCIGQFEKEIRVLAESCVTRYRHRPFELDLQRFKLSKETREILKSLEG